MERRYRTAPQAERIVRALAADQPPQVRAERDGRRVRFRVSAGSPRSVRATLEDLVVCLQAAERTA